MKKKLLWIAAILVILCIPIPIQRRDGGSVEYKAALYSAVDYDADTGNPEFPNQKIQGCCIEILGIKIYEKQYVANE